MRRHALFVAALVCAGCASVPPSSVTIEGPRAAGEPAEQTARLRFGTESELAKWRAAGGEWRVEREAAVGTQLGGQYAYLTWPVYYGRISSVTVRGRIDSKKNQNFRVAVGHVAALLNWEVRPVNVFHDGWDVRQEVGPPALSAKGTHEIRFEEEDGRIVVRVDGRALWETRGKLRGTVTIYPAVGSTIRVEEVEIRGVPVPWIAVEGPSQSAP
jgi:hypothetical protein